VKPNVETNLLDLAVSLLGEPVEKEGEFQLPRVVRAAILPPL
jgi:hypothetical protein